MDMTVCFPLQKSTARSNVPLIGRVALHIRNVLLCRREPFCHCVCVPLCVCESLFSYDGGDFNLNTQQPMGTCEVPLRRECFLRLKTWFNG